MLKSNTTVKNVQFTVVVLRISPRIYWKHLVKNIWPQRILYHTEQNMHMLYASYRCFNLNANKLKQHCITFNTCTLVRLVTFSYDSQVTVMAQYSFNNNARFFKQCTC